MPHRDFLASKLYCKLSLRSLDRRRTLQALESLYSETDTISYRDSLSPIGQACLYSKITENGYISTVTTQGITKPPTDLLKSALNESHCQEHLDNLSDLLRCDPMNFRNAPIKPGLYPFCLGTKREKPSKRMFQFILSPPKWHSHIEDHLKRLKLDFNCKHPACSTSFRSLEELTYHLVDTYC
ncbi:hypothetical protein N7449_009339 [Penicillium cf. viridicatum]|uniref:Uncharacterized protein n=1 Tax=Penicillium cf. viridicatum TaxID=2972119 RepID=A0A9W9JBT2_9EURO|nr:hypothetical protein N7449_009339 [Penicillium cf. viridicatum]